MTCLACHGLGIVPFVGTANPKADATIEASDLLFAVCLCPPGMAYRNDRNHDKRVIPLWQAWCAKNRVEVNRVFLLEQVYDAAMLASVGLAPGVPGLADRRAALLAEGNRKR
jgi:hypothetical protein